MSAHTPGPWEVRFGRRGSVNGSKPVITSMGGRAYIVSGIASGGTEPVGETIEANANLIAAAPDLLAALKGAKRLLSDLVLDGEGNDIFRAMQDAIAKAEGKTS